MFTFLARSRSGVLVAAVGWVTLVGCMGNSPSNSGDGTGGKTGSGGAPDPGSGASAGSGGATGSGGSSVATGGAVGSGGDIGGGGAGGSATIGDAAADTSVPADGAAGATGWAGIDGIEDLSTVKASAGCGMDPGQALGNWVAHNITTPQTRIGSVQRTYHVKLPKNYDKTKAYRLIYEGTNCGGCPTCVPDYAGPAGDEGVIQIALQRKDGVHTDGAGGPSCFDDKNPMSIEYPFVEAVMAEVSAKLCIDLHHVFVSGHSSGAWLSNQFGCVYGSRMIRGISPHSGGLAQGGEAPPCKDFPTPGLWTHNHDDPNNPFNGTVLAITRALRVNKCTDTNFATAKTAPYPAPGTNSCKQFTSCPKEFPIVLCDPGGGGHEGNMFWGAAWQFFKSL